MKRTQLYLEDQVWNVLHTLAKLEKTTISELVRQAVRERYIGSQKQRQAAMEQFVGSRKTSTSVSIEEEVRSLRRGARLDRLHEQ